MQWWEVSVVTGSFWVWLMQKPEELCQRSTVKASLAMWRGQLTWVQFFFHASYLLFWTEKLLMNVRSISCQSSDNIRTFIRRKTSCLWVQVDQDWSCRQCTGERCAAQSGLGMGGWVLWSAGLSWSPHREAPCQVCAPRTEAGEPAAWGYNRT